MITTWDSLVASWDDQAVTWDESPATSLLPPSATNQERALDLSTARVGEVPTDLRDLWDPDTCPAALLPWLAWGLGLDAWDNTWTEAQKRQSIREAVTFHRQRGTIGAVSRSIAPYGASVVEWFNDSPVAEPHTFTVSLDQGATSDAIYSAVIAAIRRTMNARSHFSFRTNINGSLHWAGACVCGDIVSVG